MRALSILVLVTLAVVPIVAFADDISADSPRYTGAIRRLLNRGSRGPPSQGGRQDGAGGSLQIRDLAKVAQHKTPQAPRVTRKTFERKMPDTGRHLLNLDTDINGLFIGTRQLLNRGSRGPPSQGGRQDGAGGSLQIRDLAKVAQHKTPQAPRVTRKTFERTGTGRHLLASALASVDFSIGTRQLLNRGSRGPPSQGGRQDGAGGSLQIRDLAKVAQHKTPQAPRVTRKTFERKTPL